MRLLILFSLVFPLFCFSQDSLTVDSKQDSLFIKLIDTTIGNQVLIDKINIYGDTLKSGKNGTINFLFTTKILMADLKELYIKKRYRDSLANHGIIRMPGGSRPTFGITLSYFSTDFKTVRQKVKYFNEHVSWLEALQGKKNDLTEVKIENYRQGLFESLGMPLTASFFAKNKYFENKEVFVYKGTTKSLHKLKQKIKHASKIFILIPLCGPLEFDYHVLQVI